MNRPFFFFASGFVVSSNSYFFGIPYLDAGGRSWTVGGGGLEVEKLKRKGGKEGGRGAVKVSSRVLGLKKDR